jgi:oligo-1,6-glucosidase
MRPLEDAAVCNAAAQQTDNTSVLAFWKSILQIRKEHNDLLVHGEYDDLDLDNEHLFCFSKTWKGQRAVAICNFSDKAKTLEFPGSVKDAKKQMLVSSVFEGGDEGELKAFEGRIYLLA